jgi:hypothetical protein
MPLVEQELLFLPELVFAPRFLVRFVFFKLFNCMSSHFLVPFCFVLDSCFIYFVCIYLCKLVRGRHDRMVVGFTTTYAISAYHH